MLLATASIFTIASDASTTPQITPKPVFSSPARVTTRTSLASTPIQLVRSKLTFNLPSLWAQLVPCHTSPGSPLPPTVSLTLHLPSTTLFLLPVAPRPSPPLALPSAPPAPGLPLLDLPPLPGVTAVMAVLQVSRSDPPSSQWVSAPLELSLPFSLWPELRVYYHPIPLLETFYDYTDLPIVSFDLRTDQGSQ